MALSNPVRRFQRTRTQLFLSYILAPLTQNVSSSVTPSNPCFIQTFHRTGILHSRYFTRTLYSSTHRGMNSVSVYEVADFTHTVNEDRACHQDNVLKLSNLLKKFSGFPSEEEEAMALLDDSGVEADESLVYLMIWECRQEWKISILLFKWGEKWNCNGGRNWILIIWVLGNHKKFNIAWCLIRDMHRSSLDTRKAMLIMIDRYPWAF